ncbi:unnamed protein product [Boreogadus saida]
MEPEEGLGQAQGRTLDSSSGASQVKDGARGGAACGGYGQAGLALREASTGLYQSSEPTKFLRVKQGKRRDTADVITLHQPRGHQLQALHQSVFLSSQRNSCHLPTNFLGRPVFNAHTVRPGA